MGITVFLFAYLQQQKIQLKYKITNKIDYSSQKSWLKFLITK